MYLLFVKRVNCILHCLEHAPKLFTEHGTCAVGDVTIKVIWFDLTWSFLKYLYVITSVINFNNYIYNYTVDQSLTPKPTLKPTQTTKPVPNLTRIPPQ